jgi:hypothetical protein
MVWRKAGPAKIAVTDPASASAVPNDALCAIDQPPGQRALDAAGADAEGLGQQRKSGQIHVRGQRRNVNRRGVPTPIGELS